LDSQEAAARRGLSDLQNQIGTQQARDVTDYALSQGQVQQQAGWNQQDLSQQRARGGEDYQRNVQMLTRRYGQLGQQQLQGANNAGVIRGGALLQSAAKRAENMALDRQPLDTNYQRFLADNSTQQARSQAGVTDRLGRLALDYAPPDASNPLGGRTSGISGRSRRLVRGGIRGRARRTSTRRTARRTGWCVRAISLWRTCRPARCCGSDRTGAEDGEEEDDSQVPVR
jgi:hypothetical protein